MSGDRCKVKYAVNVRVNMPFEFVSACDRATLAMAEIRIYKRYNRLLFMMLLDKK
jgi:hypothetical protein